MTSIAKVSKETGHSETDREAYELMRQFMARGGYSGAAAANDGVRFLMRLIEQGKHCSHCGTRVTYNL